MREGKIKRYHMEILGMAVPRRETPRRERMDNNFLYGSDLLKNTGTCNFLSGSDLLKNSGKNNRYNHFIIDKQVIGKNIISPDIMMLGFMVFVGTVCLNSYMN